MKKLKKFEVFLILALCVQLYLFKYLPDVIPLHWNTNWEVDRYGSKYVFLIIMLLPIITYYGINLSYRIDPKFERINTRKISYEYTRKIASLFFVIISFVLLYMSINPKYDASGILGIVFGGFFLIIGNEMPKIPQSYSFGIRTSYTLENEVVWRKTHRFGGYIFCLMGIITILCSFIFKNKVLLIMLSMLFVSMIIIFVYSYVKYKEEKER